jgi:hypothetical protein
VSTSAFGSCQNFKFQDTVQSREGYGNASSELLLFLHARTCLSSNGSQIFSQRWTTGLKRHSNSDLFASMGQGKRDDIERSRTRPSFPWSHQAHVTASVPSDTQNPLSSCCVLEYSFHSLFVTVNDPMIERAGKRCSVIQDAVSC